MQELYVALALRAFTETEGGSESDMRALRDKIVLEEEAAHGPLKTGPKQRGRRLLELGQAADAAADAAEDAADAAAAAAGGTSLGLEDPDEVMHDKVFMYQGWNSFMEKDLL